MNELISVKVSDSLEKALRLMIKHNISHIPVLYYGRYEGVVSKTSLTDYLAGCLLVNPHMTLSEAFGETTIGKILGTPLLSVNLENFFEESIGKLVNERVGSVLVFDKKECVGFLTKTDVLCALKEFVGQNALGSHSREIRSFMEKWMKENHKIKEI